jgi:hypothetical protein
MTFRLSILCKYLPKGATTLGTTTLSIMGSFATLCTNGIKHNVMLSVELYIVIPSVAFAGLYSLNLGSSVNLVNNRLVMLFFGTVIKYMLY